LIVPRQFAYCASILRRVGQQDQRKPLEIRPRFCISARSKLPMFLESGKQTSESRTHFRKRDTRPEFDFGCRQAGVSPAVQPGWLAKRSIASRQPHPLLSIAQVIPTESALDAGALGFMAKFLVQTTLPHSEQSGTQYMRADGNVTLRITDVGGTGLPYGSYPRLILIWMTTEAVRTGIESWNLAPRFRASWRNLGFRPQAATGEPSRASAIRCSA